MDYYDEDFFLRIAMPPVDCLWDWCVPLLLDEIVHIVFCVKTMFHVIKFIL
jgi:hypothetical protein